MNPGTKKALLWVGAMLVAVLIVFFGLPILLKPTNETVGTTQAVQNSVSVYSTEKELLSIVREEQKTLHEKYGEIISAQQGTIDTLIKVNERLSRPHVIKICPPQPPSSTKISGLKTKTEISWMKGEISGVREEVKGLRDNFNEFKKETSQNFGRVVNGLDRVQVEVVNLRDAWNKVSVPHHREKRPIVQAWCGDGWKE